MGKCIAVANQKGGVGKTTTSINLSAALGECGKRVLLIDLDPQGNATSGVGVDRNEDITSVYDVLVNSTAMEQATVVTEFENLSVCPSNVDLAGAEIELVGVENRENCLKIALSKVKDDYDYIIIDCPPSLGLLTLNAFVCADTILIPIQCEYYALEGLGKLLSTIKSIQKSYNPSLTYEGMLLTMFDPRLRLSNQVAEEVRTHFQNIVFKTVIQRNVKLGEAPSHGESIISYDATSRGAENYLSLASEIIGNNKQ